ncbi:hypothetical protein MG293_013419 [Ovis ammon polii]|uniref:Uncharacterized protein n=1 Tax=Ovis ammon polii TaxID=230172 RepID=A0AAD4TXH8_OVIAM|nr:hypothetical protein MG293_013419 [Ovis ammon polii]
MREGSLYETMFSKREDWQGLERSELLKYFNDCGHFPTHQQIDEVWDLVHRAFTFWNSKEFVEEKEDKTVTAMLDLHCDACAVQPIALSFYFSSLVSEPIFFLDFHCDHKADIFTNMTFVFNNKKDKPYDG